MLAYLRRVSLAQYCQEKRGRMSQLARLLQVALPTVSNWVSWHRRVPAARCLPIEKWTHGRVRAESLRPDLIWIHTKR